MIEKKIVPIHYKKLIKIFEIEGFKVSRQKGDHISMTKLGVPRPLIIKTSPKLVPVTHIRTNMITAGISRERYFELLEKV
jgi:predicted RNA binding protein YcfA (HicA-like mRNA interferase family)